MRQDAEKGKKTHHVLKVPEIVMRTLRLRNLIIWLRLSSMNYIGDGNSGQYLPFVSEWLYSHFIAS